MTKEELEAKRHEFAKSQMADYVKQIQESFKDSATPSEFHEEVKSFCRWSYVIGRQHERELDEYTYDLSKS